MEKEKWLLLAVVLATLAVMGLGVWQGIGPRSPSEPIVIGALLPLSGSSAAYGEGARKAIELALSEINGAGGIEGRQVRVIYEDTAADPERGLAAFESLTANRNISGIIGPMSSPVALAVAPRAEALGIVLLSPSASTPELTTAGDFVFRDCLSDAYEGSILANLALNGLGAETAGVLWIDNAYGRGLADVFTKSYAAYGGALVASVAYAPATKDFTELASQLAAVTAEVIVLVGYAEMADVLLALRGAGLGQQVVSSVMFDNPEILARAGAAAEGVLYTTWTPDPAKPSVAQSAFEELYVAQYGDMPGVFAAESYDALHLLALAVETEGDAADQIARGLYAIRDYQGASGTITFDENGDCIKPVFLKKVENGKGVYQPGM